MQVSTLRRDVSRRLAAFAWDEWSQMGVLADARRVSPWAADPEALLLFTLEVGRTDPRLFDEVLDWLAVNAGLVSLQRLRNHCASRTDEDLAEAALAWAGAHSDGVRIQSRPARPRESEQLFYGGRAPTAPDEVFLEYGFRKPRAQRSRKSQLPNLTRPINFAFRLRKGFGVGSRAEVMRFLLTASALSPVASRPLFTTAAIADAAAFAKRNVHDALNALAAAGWIEMVSRGNERLYRVERERWHDVLWVADQPFPGYRDWTHAFQAIAELHRWLYQRDLESLTAYIRASEARRLMSQIEPSLTYAGIPLSYRDAEGAAYWDVFTDVVDQVVSALESGLPW